MTILDTIIQHKIIEVAAAKKVTSIDQLQQMPGFSRPVFSLQQFLTDPAKTGIIAEFKRKSPSKGWINATADVVEVTQAYAAHGASCLSVLTDEHFFGGTLQDLQKARVNNLPILRKDFIIDEYQITEARAYGADVILLIAACLTPQQVQELAGYAQSIGLEVLLEIHAEEELRHVCSATNLVGINNRDLKTFEVNINKAIALANQLPAHKLKIAESGIHDIETISTFQQAGYQGFLIGENFMKQAQPAIAFAEFVQSLKNGAAS